MSYESVDQLQKVLTEKIFHYAKDRKKAAGRALGTIVENITFYLLKSWGLNDSLSIERKIPEYGFSEITHNVEYSLHPIYNEYFLDLEKDGKSITPTRILSKIEDLENIDAFKKTTNYLLTKDNILRNACTIAESKESYLIATIDNIQTDKFKIKVVEQSVKPYSIIECKRVGVEEGNKKGPQTIEKAKQGAYVARTISSLQKTRMKNGEMYGIIYIADKIPMAKPYDTMLNAIINSDSPEYLCDFILTVGIVSNHGNWFTSDNHNKELKVLAQSYDWLLFLTDAGLTGFVEEVILKPEKKYENIKNAFKLSYCKDKKKNQFTKVQMNLDADRELIEYFKQNSNRIKNWFNIITPNNEKIAALKNEIKLLKNKKWKDLLTFNS